MAQSPSDSVETDLLGEKQNSSQFVAFSVNDQQYAIRIEQIQEIVILDQVTPVPQVTDHVEGVTNLRGSIIPVINLRKRFGLQTKPADAETRTIVVNVDDRTMGCTVDQVSQVIRVADSAIRPAPDAVTSDGADYVSGFIKLGDSLAIILDIVQLLDPKDLQK